MIRARVAVAVGALVTIAGCARDRETELPERPHVRAPYGTYMRPAPPPTASNTATATSTASGPLPPPPPPSAPLPPAALPEPKIDVADLYRAQDACLSSCDQFACMKIASAYKHGAGVPNDVLAGRRYAIHACLECGKPGPGIADQCPEYKLAPEPKAK